jgi:hypothetical protein
MISRRRLAAILLLLAISAAAGFYVWRMRRRVAQIEPAANTGKPVNPPVAGSIEQVTLYVADDELGGLRPRVLRIPLPAERQQRGLEVLRTLVGVYLDKSSPHRLGPGAEIRDLYGVDAGLAVVDLNLAFADSHRSGVLVELLTMTSLVETLAANVAGVSQVKFLVDGEERETLAGHADLSNAYSVTLTTQLVNSLELSP